MSRKFVQRGVIESHARRHKPFWGFCRFFPFRIRHAIERSGAAFISLQKKRRALNGYRRFGILGAYAVKISGPICDCLEYAMFSVDASPIHNAKAFARSAIEVGQDIAEIVTPNDQPLSARVHTLLEQLYNIASALAEIALENSPPITRTIFPTEEAAKNYITTLQENQDTMYVVCRSGDGKSVVKRFKFDGLL